MEEGRARRLGRCDKVGKGRVEGEARPLLGQIKISGDGGGEWGVGGGGIGALCGEPLWMQPQRSGPQLKHFAHPDAGI